MCKKHLNCLITYNHMTDPTSKTVQLSQLCYFFYINFIGWMDDNTILSSIEQNAQVLPVLQK